MSCKIAFQVSFSSVIELLFLFELFCGTVCEGPGTVQSDYFMNQEVADFQNWLHEKISNHEIEIPHTIEPLKEPQENIHHLQRVETLTPSKKDDWDKSSEESDDFYDDFQAHLIPQTKKQPQLTSADNLPQFNHLLKRNSTAGENELLHQNPGGPIELRSEIDANEKKHHTVKEILYIRESDSDLTGSLTDFLHEVLSPKEADLKAIHPKEPDSDSRESPSTFLNEALSQDHLLPDTCSATNHSFYDRQTCPSSPRYRLEPHLSATFSEDLKSQMMERYSTLQNPEQIICGFRRRMRPDKDVSLRALCPFQWVVSKRNESRIPEYLYEAKCFCLDSCTELKSKIRVLWRVGCEDEFHVYREGWEEISAACVPTKPPITNNKKAFVVQFPAIT